MPALGTNILERWLTGDDSKQSAIVANLLEPAPNKNEQMLVISRDIKDRQWSHALIALRLPLPINAAVSVAKKSRLLTFVWPQVFAKDGLNNSKPSYLLDIVQIRPPLSIRAFQGYFQGGV